MHCVKVLVLRNDLGKVLISQKMPRDALCIVDWIFCNLIFPLYFDCKVPHKRGLNMKLSVLYFLASGNSIPVN